MKLRTTLIYLVVLAALAGLTSYLQRNVKGTDEREKTGKKLFQVKQDEILTLDLTGAGGTVHLEKKNNKWSILKPVVTAADDTAVSTLLSELEFVQSERTIQPEEFPRDTDPKKLFGLDPAACQVAWTTASGRQSLWIGRKTPSGDNYYVRTSDGVSAPVYTVKSFSKTGLDKSLSDLRSRTVFDVVSADINQISLRRVTADGRGVTEQVASRSGETWQIEKPLAVRADRAKVNSLLANVVSLRAEDFISDDSSNLSTYGLATPSGQLTLKHGKDTRETTLLIGTFDPKKPGNLFVKLLEGNTVFTLTKASLDQILNGVPEIRDRHVLVFDETKVSRISVESKGRSFEVENKNGLWHFTSAAFAADAEKIKAFVSKLASLQAANFVKDAATDLKSYSLDKPSARVVVTCLDKDKTTTCELQLGKVEKNQVYAKALAEPFIYGVDLSFADALPKDLLAWRDPQVLNLDAAKIKRLSVIDPQAHASHFDRVAANAFTTDYPGRSVDNAKVQAQLDLLAKLKTEKWIGEANPNQGFDKPYLVFTLDLEGSTVVLKVGNLQPSGNRVAQITGNPTVFELAKADLDTLDKMPLVPAAGVTPAPTK